MAQPALLSLRDLRLRYLGGAEVLCGVSLDIAAGQAVSLIGPSGSGKSVLARAALRLDEPGGAEVMGGRVLWEGRDIASLPPPALRDLRGGQIAMVFQDAGGALNPVMRIGAQMREVLTRHGHGAATGWKAQAETLLEDCQVPDPKTRLRQYPHQLSGGLRQRVMIALALAGRPRLLIADEPTSALDAGLRAALLALLDRLRREKGLALLMVTHDMAAARRMGGRVAVMEAGRVVEEGPVEDVLARPGHPQTRRLIAALPARGVAQSRAQPSVAPDRDGQKPVLSVQDLAVRYRSGAALLPGARRMVWAAHGVSFEIGAGETLALVGESGSGKTSVARAVMRLGPAAGGRVLLQGEDVLGLGPRALHAARARMQMVFQDPMGSLDPRRTLAAQVAEPLQNYRRKADRARVAELFAQVHLPADLMERYPHQVSGGQRQRVAIARALALEPALIVADEAVSALDTHVQGEVLALMQALQRRRGLAYLFISHDLALVGQIADRIAVMTEGRIVEIGPAERLLTAPVHPYSQRLMAATLDMETNGETNGAFAAPGSPPILSQRHTPAPPVYISPAPGHLVAKP